VVRVRLLRTKLVLGVRVLGSDHGYGKDLRVE